MKFILTTLFTISYFFLTAQLSESPRINYYVEVDGVDWDADPGYGDGNPEGRWRVRTKFSPFSGNSCDPDDYTNTPCIERNSSSAITGLERTLKVGTNASYNTKVYYNVLAFEKDGDKNCTYDSNDDLKHCGRGTISFNHHPVSSFHTYPWHNIQLKGWSDIRMRQIWTYYHGQWGETIQLKFGTLANGQTYRHSNSTVHRNYKGRRYGYKSTFNESGANVPGANDQPSNDVVYGFVIEEEQKRVHISTDETSFNNYVHLIRNEGGGNYSLVDSDGGDLNANINEDLCPGNYLVVVEGAGTLAGRFRLNLEVEGPEVSAGSIVHPKPYVQEDCSMTAPILSQEDGSSNFGPVNYLWQERVPNTNDWILIENATDPTLSPSDLGDISIDKEVRRVTLNQCSTVEYYSNTVTIETIGINDVGGRGNVQGKVRGKNNIGEIDGVTVYAIPSEPINGACPNQVYSGVTLQNGNYTIPQIYHGLDTITWYAVPEFFDHEFLPDTFDIESFSPQTFEFEQIDFQDTTSLVIDGRITQEDNRSLLETVCGIPEVSFLLNDVPQISTTDENGYYNLNISLRSDNNLYVVKPTDNDYDFIPNQTPPMLLFSDTSNIDFDNMQMETISGYVAACDTTCFGKTYVKFADTFSCFEFEIETNSCGFFSMDLPIREYIVTVDRAVAASLDPGYDAGEIEAYFANFKDTIDLREGGAQVYYNYRQAPEIQILGLPEICMDTVFTQSEPHTITILVSEINTNGCPLDTAIAYITDGISDRPVSAHPIKDGILEYTLLPGEPNIFASTGYKKNFNIVVEDIEDSNRRAQVNFNAIVQGRKAREATFTTTSPELPLLILRDPPGDGSYSYVETNETSQFGFSMSVLKGGAVETTTKIDLGFEFSTGIGYSTDNVLINDFENKIKVEGRNTNRTEQLWTLTTGERFQTRETDDVMGEDADIFVAGALNLRYAISDIRTYNEATCSIEEDEALVVAPEAVETMAIYSANRIKNGLIPEFKGLKELTSNPDSILYYENQVQAWQQMLDRNNDAKQTAIPDTIPSISWDGGIGEIEKWSYTNSTKSNTFDVSLSIESSVAAKLGYSISGIGASTKVAISSKFEIGGGTVTNTISERRHGFVLKDNDPEDFFETSIFYDEVYGTHVFKNTSSGTTCPYEGGSKIDMPIISVDNPVAIDVPADKAAVFNISVTNGTDLLDTSSFANRGFCVDIVSNSNPHSAGITVGDEGFPLCFAPIPRGSKIDRQVDIKRNENGNFYSYEGIRLVAYPDCGDDNLNVSSSIDLTAHFISTCSDIKMNTPVTDWLINGNSGNSLTIHLTDYNKSLITEVTPQYSIRGINDWDDITSIPVGDLVNNPVAGTFYSWNTSNVPDGAYDVRLKLTCPNGVIYTERASGLIDRTKPQLLGLASPIDAEYDITENDEISARFTEAINCDASTQVILQNMENGDEYNAMLTCGIDEVNIVPNDLLHLLDPAAYRVILSSVKDIHGNIASTYRWAFIVGNYVYDPDCSPILIGNNNINQDAISQSQYYSEQIISNGTVKDGSTVGFTAEQEIQIEPGFEVKNGAELNAAIDTCPNDD